jgi:hypothetical protein
MSSHHIVKDEQEPALLIADPSALSLEYVELLLEWSPTVLVTEPALNEVLRWGIKVDVVVAQSGSLEQLKPRLQEQSPVKLLGFESTDLLACAFIFLEDHSYKAVNVLADIYNSRVLDLSKSYKPAIDTVIFYNNQKWSYINTGRYSKWVTTGHHFGIHPVAQHTFFRSEGFYGDWENEMLLEPIELTAEISGKVLLLTNHKPLWIVEEVSTDLYQ